MSIRSFWAVVWWYRLNNSETTHVYFPLHLTFSQIYKMYWGRKIEKSANVSVKHRIQLARLSDPHCLNLSKTWYFKLKKKTCALRTSLFDAFIKSSTVEQCTPHPFSAQTFQESVTTGAKKHFAMARRHKPTHGMRFFEMPSTTARFCFSGLMSTSYCFMWQLEWS